MTLDEPEEHPLEQKLMSYGIACGCNDFDEVCQTLVAIFEEIESKAKGAPYQMERCCAAARISVGAYYLIIEALQKAKEFESDDPWEPADIIVEGGSARTAWLGDSGKQLLAEMKAYLAEGKHD